VRATATAIPVSDVSQFPNSGTIQIDQELMHYDGKQPAAAASSFGAAAATQPGVLLNVQRGGNGTAPAPHQSGAVVILISVSGPACVGDCNNGGDVTVNELIAMVNIALGNAALSACPVGDVNANGAIEINEIITAVNNALNGCE
jgi:hypothetical protein